MALTRSGIVAELAATKFFVPWDAIDDIEDVEMKIYVKGSTTREPFIGLHISNLDLVEMSNTARLFSGLDNRFLGTDINLPVRTLDVDPRLLLEAIRFYWKTPDKRAELGADTIPDRFLARHA